MQEQLSYLEIEGPDGQAFQVDLVEEQTTVGRFREFNDIALASDPQQLITKKGHCVFQRISGSWWIVDNNSTNGTFLQRDQQWMRVIGREALSDGDVIRILGRFDEKGDHAYWLLTFRDPLRTQQVDWKSDTIHLHYDWIQAKLFRVDGANREEISNLRPQEHKLVRYMDNQNRLNGNVPVMCSYEELIEAIWGDEKFGHTETEVNRLVWELRQKIEGDTSQPRFLETVKGLGYRLVTNPQM